VPVGARESMRARARVRRTVRGLSAALSARPSGSHVRFVSTGTHSGSRTNRTDKFFPIGCPLVRTRRFSSRAGDPRVLLSVFVRPGEARRFTLAPRGRRGARRSRSPAPPLNVRVTARPTHSPGCSRGSPNGMRYPCRAADPWDRVPASGVRLSPTRLLTPPSGGRTGSTHFSSRVGRFPLPLSGTGEAAAEVSEPRLVNGSARLRLRWTAGIKPAPSCLASQRTGASLGKLPREPPIFSEGSWSVD
jgi:hypothetical protein